ncbi:MAG: hypothetical protein METHAR1v1_1060018 [Methanothrix sp.]|nr:MAG: hypothetical protein METHAR1v1_1060018 [Methanothrix sp.]
MEYPVLWGDLVRDDRLFIKKRDTVTERHCGARGTKGAKLTAILFIAVFAMGGAAGTPAISEEAQGENFYNRVRASGTGYFEVGSSVVDRRIGLEYSSFIYGDGRLEMDSRAAVSTSATAIRGSLDGGPVPLNLVEDLKISYSGETPMVGAKSIHSRAFYGGIGAKVEERFEVTEMERVQTTYFASSAPPSPSKDPADTSVPRAVGTSHLVGMDVSTSFTGTWESDYRWHQIFYKDMKEHQTFSGVFEVERTLRFSESPDTGAFKRLLP